MLGDLSTSPLWAGSSCCVEKLGLVRRNGLLGCARFHSAVSDLFCQKVLDHILLFEVPLREGNAGRPALRLYVVQYIGPADLQ
jgi:hypothetical protein